MAKNTNGLLRKSLLLIILICLGCSQQDYIEPIKVAYIESEILERIVTFATLQVTNDFTRSSKLSKERLLPNLQDALSTIMWNDYVIGWAILSLDGEIIFRFGKDSRLIISAEICTINGVLNLYSGYCSGELILYISKEKLEKYLGNNTVNCKSCYYRLFSHKQNRTINIISNINVLCDTYRFKN